MTFFYRALLLSMVLFFPAKKVYADEGMWLPSLISERIIDMQSKGLKLTSEDIYSVNKVSMKDGIVKFGRGCTGAFISPEGLLVTNHHCGYSQIQSHSSLENDYLKNGFWAFNPQEELPNPGLEVTLLVRMEDVTEEVLYGLDQLKDQSEENREAHISNNISRITKQAIEGTHYKASVESFFYGNQYFLFINEVFTDVRLVAAPPSSIGKFGGDQDNWMWPRHTGDFSMFRVYSGIDNTPAPYSKDNIPYKPKKHFVISTGGINEGDFTMIYGFPGSTQQFIVSDAVDYILNYSNPAKIKLRSLRLDIIEKAQQSDPKLQIAYAAKHAGISNAWKKWQGESLGLQRLGSLEKKKSCENEFSKWSSTQDSYDGVLEQMKETYRQMLPYAIARDYYNEAVMAIELMKTIKDFLQTGLDSDTLPVTLDVFYKDYSPEIDKQAAVILMKEYIENLSDDFVPSELKNGIKKHGSVEKYIDELFSSTVLTSKERIWAVYKTDCRKEIMDQDPAVRLYKEFNNLYEETINSNYTLHSKALNSLYHRYVKGIMDFENEYGSKDFFPDANLTLRVAYGKIEGYIPSDAVYHLPQTTLEGVIQKYIPGNYYFDLPKALLDIYEKKDYGRWEVDGTVPVCFLATNHTTGGNSGSPVLNGYGELVGINFDRTWYSTMSDIEFDSEMCRNIALDIRYMLFVVDKIGGCGYLIEEMSLKYTL